MDDFIFLSNTYSNPLIKALYNYIYLVDIGFTQKKIFGHELVIPLTCVGCVGYNFAVDYVPQHRMPLLKYTIAKIEKD